MLFNQDFGTDASVGFSDFSTRLGTAPAPTVDFASLLGGLGVKSSTAGQISGVASQIGGIVNTLSSSGSGGGGGGFASFLGSAASGAGAGMAFGPYGAAIGGALGGITALFGGGKKTDEAAQTRDINTIAAAYGITGAEAGAVIANHCDHTSDHFDDLAASVAKSDGLRRFPELLAEYNSAHPNEPIRIGSLRAQAEAVANSQQQLITTALQTQNFASTAQGQQLVQGLQSLPSSQAVGTQGQTAGDILAQILKGMGAGIVKGGGDAAAETDLGKSFKSSYLKDWLKDNQLLAGVVAAALGYTGWRAFGPKGRKTSL